LRSLQGLPLRHQYFLPVVKFIAQRNTSPVAVLEIGSWAGASSISWAKAIRKMSLQGRVTCVDHWQPYFDMTRESDGHYADMNLAAQNGDIFKLFLHNIKVEGVGDMVHAHIGKSEVVLPTLEAKSFDIIYIDGSHSFHDVLSDIKNAKRLIAQEGIICGDDLELQKHQVVEIEHAQAVLYDKDYVYSDAAKASYHPGVTEAVALEFERVSVWDGFWATSRTFGIWGDVELNLTNLEIPEHLIPSLGDGVGKLCAETSAFNLVEAEGRYWAISKALGPTDLFKERLGERDLPPVLFNAKTLEALQEKIEQFVPRVHEPPRLLESFQGYNLVEYEGIIWIVAIAAGPVDLTIPESKRALLSQGQLMCAATVEDARSAVKRKEHESPTG
jgi:predicted O-methyltransferase YrrM